MPLTDSMLLVIYLLQRQGCPSQQVNQPTHAQNIQTPSHLFHSHSGNLLQPLSASPPSHCSPSAQLAPGARHSGASPVPSDAGQWPLLSHMRLHQLPLSSTCRHRPNPTCHRHHCARPVLYMGIQNIKWEIQNMPHSIYFIEIRTCSTSFTLHSTCPLQNSLFKK